MVIALDGFNLTKSFCIRPAVSELLKIDHSQAANYARRTRDAAIVRSTVQS